MKWRATCALRACSTAGISASWDNRSIALLASNIPEVSSPLARRIVSQVFNLAPFISPHRASVGARPDYLRAYEHAPYIYRELLIEALYRSDLAQRLASPDSMPLPQNHASS